MTFDAIQNAYCRVVDSRNQELVRYCLNKSNHREKSGLIMARLMRRPGGQWGMEASGTFCRGRTWMDPACVNAMKRIVFLSELKHIKKEPFHGVQALGEELSPEALAALRPHTPRKEASQRDISPANTRSASKRLSLPPYGRVSL
mmetsp:Transcript_151463/g.268203  ORF Transcript_151463/g.268203 Transcript_151463/m.268203 type:complete len:145 (+) Transcript_151463:1-435(+)